MDKKLREEIESESPDTAENREKKTTVSLDGTAITASGKLTKSNFFRFLNHSLDDYSDIQMTPDEARRVHSHLQKLSTGATAMVPMFCGGDRCPTKDRCPLYAINKAPVGRQCLIEAQLITEWTIRYMEEYDIDPNNFTEVTMINELADLQILEMRINTNLSKPENAALIINQSVGIDRDGDPIIQQVVSPLMDLKERIAGRRSKIIKLMVGDRQEKYKKEAALKVRIDDDPSSQMSTMRSKLESLKRELDKYEVPSSPLKKETMSPEDLMASIDDEE